MTSQAPRRTFDVHEYHRMSEAGILTEDDRIELIEGELTEMSPIGSRHAACVMRLTKLLERAVGERYIINIQNPVRLDDLSEPEPDVAVLRYREDFYAESHPAPQDALLLIEISDTSLDYDRTVKLPLYAKHEIPEVWIVDLQSSRSIEVYTNPDGDRYTALTTKRVGESVKSGVGFCAAVGEIVG